MECLLFGGAESVGKSSAIYRLASILTGMYVGVTASPFSIFTVVAGKVPSKFKDFHAVLEGKNRDGQVIRIIINSPTDNDRIIDRFKDFYDKNGSYDILISSVKDDSYSVRDYFFKTINIAFPKDYIVELPLAKITRQNANKKTCRDWYERQLDILVNHILAGTPFNL